MREDAGEEEREGRKERIEDIKRKRKRRGRMRDKEREE